MKQLLILTSVTALLLSCVPKGFEDSANAQFADQHFKTAIALIELHKVREGEYPVVLDSIKYLGDWDHAMTASVKYERLEEGYALDLVSGPMGKAPKLNYPAEFWKGLGLKKSNLK